MNRRTFLQASAMAGLSVFTPTPYGVRGADDFQPYEGPYWLMLNCVGGWDTTLFCDPKGLDVEVKPGRPVNTVFHGDDRINWGTPGDPVWMAPEFADSDFYSFFFNAHKDKVLIVNGVDSETNGHVQGERVTWSGQLQRGYPSLAALIAAESLGPLSLPVPFLTFGGYDATGDLVTPTRFKNMDVFSKVALPGVAAFDAAGAPERFHTSRTQAIIDARAAARLEAARANAELPRKSAGLDALYTARLSERNVERILDRLDLERFNDFDPRTEGLRRQCLLALTSFQAGVCVSANLALKGWDTHTRNDTSQVVRLRQLFTALGDVMTWAEEMSILDKINVVVASDFGRTPYHNSGEGKDHWSVGSWMMMLNASAPPGRLSVVGGTSDVDLKALPVSDQLVTLQAGQMGTKLTPAHLHKALRAVAGIDQGAYVGSYPLEVPTLPFFGGGA